MNRSSTSLVPPLLLVILVWGCSHPPVHVLFSPAPVLPGGWTLQDDSQDGIKLGVPSGWHEGVDTTFSGLQMAGSLPQDSSGSNGEANNPVAGLVSQMKSDDAAQQKQGLADLRAKGTVIHIIDSSKPTPGELRTEFYVKKIDHDGNWSLDAARDDEKEFYRGWGADPPVKVQLPIGPAYKFTCDHKTRGGDDVTRISYVVVDGKETYLLRFVSTNNPQAVTSISEDVAKSWRIKPSV